MRKLIILIILSGSITAQEVSFDFNVNIPTNQVGEAVQPGGGFEVAIFHHIKNSYVKFIPASVKAMKSQKTNSTDRLGKDFLFIGAGIGYFYKATETLSVGITAKGGLNDFTAAKDGFIGISFDKYSGEMLSASFGYEQNLFDNYGLVVVSLGIKF